MEIFKKTLVAFIVIMMIFPCMLFAANWNKNIIDVQMTNEIGKEQYYFKGNELDLTDLEIKVFYDDLTFEILTIGDARVKVEGFDSNILGPQTVKIKLLDHGVYRDIYEYKAIILEQKSLLSFAENTESNVLKIGAPSERDRRKTVLDLMVVNMPNREQVYTLGEEIDLEGLVIGVQYSNDTYEEIPYNDSRLSYSYDSSYIGTQNVYVTYSRTGSFNMVSSYTVYLFDILITENDAKVVTNMNIDTLPTKLEYQVGEDLDLTGGAIEIFYNDGTSETYEMGNSLFKNFNFINTEIGNQEIVIQLASDVNDEVDYYKKYVSFNVIVSDIETSGEEEIIAGSKNYRISSNDLNGTIINELYDLKNVNFPARYNMNDKFILRAANQGVLGLCALFATNKGLETNYAYSNGKLYDLSERYMDYMTSPLLYGIREIGSIDNKIEGDGVGFTSELPLMEMYGSALESDVPYRDYTSEEIQVLANSKLVSKLNSCIYFSKVATTDSDYERFKNIIKTHIMQYGSMYICIANPSQAGLLNKSTNAYYRSENATNSTSLHAVSIVGWDDNYSKDNFATTPENDGAWIVLNSWGDAWGDNGYFYISYDSDFFNMFGILDTEKVHATKEYTYSKDLLNKDFTYGENDTSYYYYVEFNMNSGDSEYLENIIIPNQVYSNEKNIKVYIVNDYDGTNIKSRKCIGELSSNNAFGVSNLILDKPLKLEGERFLIIVECPVNCYLPMYEVSNNHTYYTTNRISSRYTQASYELPIFAYTIDEKEYSEYEKANNITDIEIDTLPTKTTLVVGEELDLNGGKIKVNYQDGTNEIIDMEDEEVGYYGITSTSFIGDNVITVLYKENKANFNVTISEKTSGDNEGESSGDTNKDDNTSGNSSNSSGGSNSSSSSGGSNSSDGSSTSKPSSSGGGGGGGSTTVKTYKITVKDSKNGEIIPSTTTVEKGEDKKFTIQANIGYVIKDVVVDGKSVGAVDTFLFEDVTETHTISAIFEKQNEEVIDEVNHQSGDSETSVSGDVSDIVPTSPNLGNQSAFELFEDVASSDWYYESIKFAVENQLFNGISAVKFGPQINMTRGMLVTVLYRLDGATERDVATFSDVGVSSYYTYAISWAAKNGIVKGIGNNKFSPDSSISREDLATIIARYIVFKKINIDDEISEMNQFSDASMISEYAKESVDTLIKKGLMQGKSKSIFDPKGMTTRAEVATILMRLMKKMK